MNLSSILIKPLITEKVTTATEKFNRFAFVVNVKANKHQIKTAVESFYNVKVLDIKTSVMPGKLRRTGKSVKKSGKIKKAFVRLGEGQEIKFFTGV